jgi:hypothetical protein
MAKLLGIIISTVLFALGLLFLIASPAANTLPRIVIGVIALLMGAGVLWLAVLKRTTEVINKTEVTQKIDLSGQINLENLKCKNCGAGLDSKSVTVREGVTFIKCSACGSEYEIAEAPKW